MDSSIPTLQAVLQQAREQGDRESAFAAHVAIGAKLLGEGGYAWAQEHFESALSIAEALSDRAMAGQALHGLGAALAMNGFVPQGVEQLQAGLAIVRDLGDSSGEAQIQRTLDKIALDGATRKEQAENRLERSMARHAQLTVERDRRLLARYLEKERARPTAHRFRDPHPLWALRCLRCPFDYFVSYRHADAREYCVALCDGLAKRGLRPFFAPDLGIREPFEGEDEWAYREHVEGILRPGINRAKILLMVAGGSYLGSEWTKWEVEIFEQGPAAHGREGKMLSIVGPTMSTPERMIVWLKSATDAVPICETFEGWASGCPSNFVLDGLVFHAERYRRELLTQLWLWLVPRFLREKMFVEARAVPPALLEQYIDLEGTQ